MFRCSYLGGVDGRRCSVQRGSGDQNFSLVSMNHLFSPLQMLAALFVCPANVFSAACAVCVCTPMCALSWGGGRASRSRWFRPPNHLPLRLLSPPSPPRPLPLFSLLLTPALPMQWLRVTEPVLCQKRAIDCQSYLLLFSDPIFFRLVFFLFLHFYLLKPSKIQSGTVQLFFLFFFK